MYILQKCKNWYNQTSFQSKWCLMFAASQDGGRNCNCMKTFGELFPGCFRAASETHLHEAKKPYPFSEEPASFSWSSYILRKSRWKPAKPQILKIQSVNFISQSANKSVNSRTLYSPQSKKSGRKASTCAVGLLKYVFLCPVRKQVLPLVCIQIDNPYVFTDVQSTIRI